MCNDKHGGRDYTGKWKILYVLQIKVSVSHLLYRKATPCSDYNVPYQKRVHKDKWDYK